MRERQKEHYTPTSNRDIDRIKSYLPLPYLSIITGYVPNKVVLARCLLVWIPFINRRQVYESKSKVYCKVCKSVWRR